MADINANIDPASHKLTEVHQQLEHVPIQHRVYGDSTFVETGPRGNAFERPPQLPMKYGPHGEPTYFQARQPEGSYPQLGQKPMLDRAYLDQSFTEARQPRGVSSPPGQVPLQNIGQPPTTFYRMTSCILLANQTVIQENKDPVYVDTQGHSRPAHLNNVLFSGPMVTYGSTGSRVESVPYEYRLEPSSGRRPQALIQQPRKHPYRPEYQEAHLEAYENMYGRPFEQRDQRTSQLPRPQDTPQPAEQCGQQFSYEAYERFSKMPERKDPLHSDQQSSQNLSDNVSVPMSLDSDDEDADSAGDETNEAGTATAEETTMCPNCMRELPSICYRERYWGLSKHCNRCVDEWSQSDARGKVCKMCLFWNPGRNYESPKGIVLLACSRCRQEMNQTKQRITQEARRRRKLRLDRETEEVDDYKKRVACRRYLLKEAEDADREERRKGMQKQREMREMAPSWTP